MLEISEKFELPEEPQPKLKELKPHPPVLPNLPPKPDCDNHKLQNNSKSHTLHEPKSFRMHYSSVQISDVKSTNSTKEPYLRNQQAAAGHDINESNSSTVSTGIQRTNPSQVKVDSVPHYGRSDSSMGIGHLETVYVRKIQEKPDAISTISESDQKPQNEMIKRKLFEQQQRLKISENRQNAAIEQSDSRAEIPADLQNGTNQYSIFISNMYM